MKKDKMFALKKNTCHFLGVFLLVMLATLCMVSEANATNFGDEFYLAIQVTERYGDSFSLLDYINKERKELGRTELVMDKYMMEVAAQRAAEVNVLNEHYRPNGTDCTVEFNAADKDLGFYGENICTAAVSAASVYNQWYKSPDGHHQAMISTNWKSVGICLSDGVAVAVFSIKDARSPLERMTGTSVVTKKVQCRMAFTAFTTNRGNVIDFGESCQLQFMSTINTDILTEIDASMFSFQSTDPSILSVSSDGIVKANKVGTANIVVALKSNSAVKCSTAITVEPLDVNIVGAVTCSYQKTQNYTGTAITPKVSIRDKFGNVMKEGTDFSVRYGNNVEPGYADIWIDGKGNYIDTTHESFVIIKNSGTSTSGSGSSSIGSGESTGTGSNPSTGTDTSGSNPEDDSSGYWVITTPSTTDPGNTVSGKQFVLKLKKTVYTYSGKAFKPGVTVYAENKKISSKYYSVQYKNNKNVGIGKVLVVGRGKYSGYKGTADFTIGLKKTALSSVKSKKQGQLTIKWKKGIQNQGYQIQYSTNKKFRGAETITVKGAKKTSVTLKKLKSKKKYYVRIRTYKGVNGKYWYSPWSKTKAAKVK